MVAMEAVLVIPGGHADCQCRPWEQPYHDIEVKKERKKNVVSKGSSRCEKATCPGGIGGMAGSG